MSDVKWTDMSGPASDESSSAVSWSAIFVGTISAMAGVYLLVALGGSIGGVAAIGKSPWAAFYAASWAFVANVGSMALGGYIAGRLRVTRDQNLPNEARFRDAAHGFAMWALATVVDVEFQRLNGLVPAMSLWTAFTMSVSLVAAVVAARYGGGARRRCSRSPSHTAVGTGRVFKMSRRSRSSTRSGIGSVRHSSSTQRSSPLAYS